MENLHLFYIFKIKSLKMLGDGGRDGGRDGSRDGGRDEGRDVEGMG